MSARVEAAAQAISDVNGAANVARLTLAAADQIMFSEAAIERAAKAGFESVSGLMGFPGPFETAPEPLRKTYRDIARAVVAALREET
jgi:hypothetical protein